MAALIFAKAAKCVAAAVGGVMAVSFAELLTLQAIGFTAAGPAAGSFAAGLMSSIATASGGRVATGSLYSVAQAAAMGGGAVLGAPVLLAVGATAAAVACVL